MTATEKLRQLLDERGVEYDVDDTQVDGNGTMYRVTYVKEGYGRTWVYEEPPDCALLVSYNHDLGAEDAIDATLGRGTCRNVGYYIDGTRFKCSACGYNGWVKWASDGMDRVPHYCPSCGAEVVDA